MNKFPERFKDEMVSRGLNPSQFAKLLGISQQNVHRYLSEGRTPNGDALTQICEKLKISADWILGITHENEVQKTVVEKKDVGISSESVERLIEQNSDLSRAAAAMGEAHKTIAEANALLAQTNAQLVNAADELCKEIRHLKVDTPAKPVHTGGGRVTKHAATG